MSPATRCAQKHAKARRRRYRTAQERLAQDRCQAQHAAEALQQALDDLGLPEDLVTESAGRLRSQKKLLGKIVGVMCPPLFGCRTNPELCRVRGWDKNLPSRLLGVLPPRSPTAPPAHRPSRAGPAAAVWWPALAAPGGRPWALVRWGRPRAVARGRQGGGRTRWQRPFPCRRPRRAAPAALAARPLAWPCPAARAGGLLAPARAGPPRVWAPPGPPWQGRRQAGSVGRVGRPQAWAPAGAGWQGVGGRGRVGKWLYFSYTLLLPPFLL
jgi:hypothetical protein